MLEAIRDPANIATRIPHHKRVETRKPKFVVGIASPVRSDRIRENGLRLRMSVTELTGNRAGIGDINLQKERDGVFDADPSTIADWPRFLGNLCVDLVVQGMSMSIQSSIMQVCSVMRSLYLDLLACVLAQLFDLCGEDANLIST